MKFFSVKDISASAPACRTVTTANRKFTAGLFLNANHNNHAVRRIGWTSRDIHTLKKAKRFKTAFGLLNLNLIERITFGNVEFAADDIIAGHVIANDHDAVDIGARHPDQSDR